MHRSRRCVPRQLLVDFRTYFITCTTNAYATMHYDIATPAECFPLQQLDSAIENPARSPAPAGVNERDDPFLRHREVHRYAVRDGDGQELTVGPCGVAVDAVENMPAGARCPVPRDRDAMHLMTQDDGWKPFTERGAECTPAGHHLPYRLFTPEAEAKARTTCLAARRDTGDDTVAIRPLGKLHPGHGGIADERLGDGRQTLIPSV